MSEKKKLNMMFSQIEDALEERQSNDRRQKQKSIPLDVKEERRKSDRRTKKAHS